MLGGSRVNLHTKKNRVMISCFFNCFAKID